MYKIKHTLKVSSRPINCKLYTGTNIRLSTSKFVIIVSTNYNTLHYLQTTNNKLN